MFEGSEHFQGDKHSYFIITSYTDLPDGMGIHRKEVVTGLVNLKVFVAIVYGIHVGHHTGI